jgi:hypothetical protein
LDTKGNIFGGFTPVERESPEREIPSSKSGSVRNSDSYSLKF